MCTCPPCVRVRPGAACVRLYILAQPCTPASSVQYRERRTTSISDQQSRFRHRFIDKMMLKLQAVLVLCLVAGTWADSISPKLQQHIVDWHNEYRRSMNSTNMMKIEWSEDAAAEAENLVKGCKSLLRSPLKYNVLFRPINDDDFDATEFVDRTLEIWAGAASKWLIKGGRRVFGDRDSFTKERWILHQHPAMDFTSKVGCAYKTCKTENTLVCFYMPDHKSFKLEVVFKTGGAPCSACTKDQTCDNGLCVGDRCIDKFGSWICRHHQERHEICTNKHVPIKWREDICPVTCDYCPK